MELTNGQLISLSDERIKDYRTRLESDEKDDWLRILWKIFLRQEKNWNKRLRLYQKEEQNFGLIFKFEHTTVFQELHKNKEELYLEEIKHLNTVY